MAWSDAARAAALEARRAHAKNSVVKRNYAKASEYVAHVNSLRKGKPTPNSPSLDKVYTGNRDITRRVQTVREHFAHSLRFARAAGFKGDAARKSAYEASKFSLGGNAVRAFKPKGR